MLNLVENLLRIEVGGNLILLLGCDLGWHPDSESVEILTGNHKCEVHRRTYPVGQQNLSLLDSCRGRLRGHDGKLETRTGDLLAELLTLNGCGQRIDILRELLSWRIVFGIVTCQRSFELLAILDDLIILFLIRNVGEGI